jgi:signal transduction histidine kinase
VFRLLGSGPQAAAWQAVALLLLAGSLALLTILNTPGHAHRLLIVAACDFGTALLALLVPWRRTPAHAPAAIGVPAFAVLGLSTWSFGGTATGTGPFLVLLYAWSALHFPRWVLLAYIPPATASYVTPLILTHQPPEVVGSAFVLLPVALAVAFLIEAQARHLREDRERLARIEHWRSAMIGTLAHDVRGPLTTVQMALEELRGQVPGTSAWMLDSALRQTARLARLAENLLDLHRIDSDGHLKLDRQLVPARGLVESPGVPEALRPTLFSPFAAAGTDSVGLGLWIVRQLAEAHGGRAVAEARTPGVAMIVTFRAPTG